jgi:hypothetical protein
MESNFNNREFEQFVKKSADQYRMIPSDKVWKGINSSLHSRKKWGIGLGLLLLISGTAVTWVMVSYPVTKKQEASIINAHAPAASLPVAASQSNNTSHPKNINSLLAFNKYTQQENEEIATPQNFFTHTDNDIINTQPANVSAASEVIASQEPNRFQGNVSIKNDETNILSFGIITTDPLESMLVPIASTVDKSVSVKEETKPKPNNVYYPYTIESVVNAYQAKKPVKHVSWQLYFSPTISYRKLSENRAYHSSSPFDPIVYPFASLTDVNRAVTHKPDMGLELGATAKYPLTNNLKLRAGVQFNVNRYDIKAFAYNGEQATINLAGGGNNSVTAWTYYRNYNGYKTDWLKNFYFSVSAPVGAELKLLGNSKTSFGIAGTVQPTYIIKERAFLLSTDYKNYANVPWLVRRVNVNTSFEAFIAYTNHRTHWQVGPQIRYQALSSFQNQYPVKENLFDFGMKVGVTIN